MMAMTPIKLVTAAVIITNATETRTARLVVVFVATATGRFIKKLECTTDND